MRTFEINAEACVGASVTVYTVGAFGASTERGKLKSVHLAPNGNRSIELVPKGKRKPVVVRSATLVCLMGEHPDAPGGLVKVSDGERSRYGSFDERYITDFNKWINDRLAVATGVGILAYQTETPGETVPTATE